MKKLTKYLALIVPLISLTSVAYLKTAHGDINDPKQDERFQESATYQFPVEGAR